MPQKQEYSFFPLSLPNDNGVQKPLMLHTQKEHFVLAQNHKTYF